MHIVLIEPEIPSNTGNIVRTCAATGTSLHLVGPLGFSLKDKYLKRAGLDYWDLAMVFQHDSFEDLRSKYPENRFYFTSKKGRRLYTDVKYSRDDFLVFGKETEGLPDSILDQNPDTTLKIPKLPEARSLNLSNAVAIVLYEALRQLDFNGGVHLE
jgi:tRNA (cytidine/uridine-2'-O-)-methyltransferase